MSSWAQPWSLQKIKLGSERGLKNNNYTILVIDRGGEREDGKPAVKIREHDISFSRLLKVI